VVVVGFAAVVPIVVGDDDDDEEQAPAQTAPTNRVTVRRRARSAITQRSLLQLGRPVSSAGTWEGEECCRKQWMSRRSERR
jgi:hypothetical protein